MSGERITKQVVYGVAGFILGSWVFLGGCQYQGPDAGAWGKSPGKEGYHAFLQGDYPRARKVFSLLAEEAKDPRSAASGIYGRACVDMVTAEDTKAFYSAMDPLLQRLGDGSGGVNGFTGQPPGLLIKAMARGALLMEKERITALARLKKEKEKGIKLEMKMKDLKKQISILNNQISALERLDTTLQEKRKDQ